MSGHHCRRAQPGQEELPSAIDGRLNGQPESSGQGNRHKDVAEDQRRPQSCTSGVGACTDLEQPRTHPGIVGEQLEHWPSGIGAMTALRHVARLA